MTRIDAAISIGILGATMLVGFLLAREAEASKALAAKLSICNATKPDAIQIREPEPKQPREAPRPTVMPPDMTTLHVGDMLIYASGKRGSVLDIAAMGDVWVVKTTRETGAYARYGTSTHGGENIKGVVR